MKKRFTVIHGTRYNPQVVEVTLNGVDASERLTPRMAARAAFVGCGHRDSVTVWSSEAYGYRLYAGSHRKVSGDDKGKEEARDV